MKKPWPQFVLTGLLVLLMGIACAQPGHHGMRGDHDYGELVEYMTRRLQLDDTQQQKVRNIIDAMKPEAEALRAEAQANREAMHALDVADSNYDTKLQNLAVQNGELVTKLTLLRGRLMAEVSAELNDEQKAMLSKGRDRMHRRSRQHRRGEKAEHDTTS